MKFWTCTLIRAWAFLCVLGVVPTAVARVPVETFFKPDEYGGAVLSPSGRYLAVLSPLQGRRNVAIINLETRQASWMTNFSESDAIRVAWLTDKRLLVTQGELKIGSAESQSVVSLTAADMDGTNRRDVGRSIGSFFRPRLVRILGDSDDIIVSVPNHGSLDLYKFNTRSGDKELLTFSPPGLAESWVVDRENVPRAVIVGDYKKDISAWYVRASVDAPWKKVAEAKYDMLQQRPLVFSDDGKTLYVASREGRDRMAIFEYSVASGDWKGPVIQHPERDINPRFVRDRTSGNLVGFVYSDDRPSSLWFDETWAKMQNSIDKAFPNTVNALQRAGDRWIVWVSGDRNPGEIYLLDSKTMAMERLFSTAKWLKPADLSSTRWVSYAARDGLRIPALLTVPNAKEGKRLPLIVHIHGGPYEAADEWEFDPEVQFLASRGYAVIQPQFRGTEGFGWKHFSAGFRQWGEAMQDDLEDGVKWAVDKGIADADKVCFFGSSYGGYAALWGSIKNAKLIKCAISYAGVTSLEYMFDRVDTDLADYVDKASGYVKTVGDPKSERERFKRVSPLEHADQVGVPILLGHGDYDSRVPIAHSADFRSKLDKFNKSYEWIRYKNEGHGLSKPENIVDFYSRVEKFLAKHLGAVE